MKSFTAYLFLISLMYETHAIEDKFLDAKKFELPRRSISVIAGEKGYYPQHITAFVGEQVSLYVTAATKMPSCLIMNEHEVYVEAKKGEIREATIYLDTPGRFKFYCPSGQINGTLTVIDHPREQKDKKREVASQKDEKVQIWRPRKE